MSANRSSHGSDLFNSTVGWPKVTRVPIPANKSRSAPSSPSFPRRSSSSGQSLSPPRESNISTSPSRSSPPKGLPPWILARKGRASQKSQPAHAKSNPTSPSGNVAGLPPWARKYMPAVGSVRPSGGEGGVHPGEGESQNNKMMRWDEVEALQMPPKRR